MEPPRFITRLVHCSEGSPPLPAWRDTVLALDSHNVSNRTRSRDLYSDIRCQTVVPRNIGESPMEFVVASSSKKVCFRGRKSVAEKTPLSLNVGAVKFPGVGGAEVPRGLDRRNSRLSAALAPR